MRPHESPRINKKSIRGDSRDSWPVWNRGISGEGGGDFNHCHAYLQALDKHCLW